MEIRAFPMELRALEEDGRISAYAATFGNVYDVGFGVKETIERGAFTKTLKENHTRPILWQHDISAPIGVETAAYEDDHGLLVEGQLNLEVQQAREARSLALQGAITGISMGFIPIKKDLDDTANVVRQREVKLMEWSLVTFPANTKARIKKVRTGLENYPESVLYEIIGLAGDESARLLDYNLVHRAATALLELADRIALPLTTEPPEGTPAEQEPQKLVTMTDDECIARALAELGIV